MTRLQFLNRQAMQLILEDRPTSLVLVNPEWLEALDKHGPMPEPADAIHFPEEQPCQ